MERKRTGYQISWTKRATQQLLALAAFIGETSEQQSRKVVLALHTTIAQAAKNPLRFSPDNYRVSNDGAYRAFQKYRYRVTYRILMQEIRIVYIRHVRQKPLFY